MKGLAEAGYWYFTEIVECPVCLGRRYFRERRHCRKPTDWCERNKFTTLYCGCMG